MKQVDKGVLRMMADRPSALLLAGWLFCIGLATGHSVARADVSREILNITDALIHSPAAATMSVAKIHEPRVVDLVYQQVAHQPLWEKAQAVQMHSAPDSFPATSFFWVRSMDSSSFMPHRGAPQHSSLMGQSTL